MENNQGIKSHNYSGLIISGIILIAGIILFLYADSTCNQLHNNYMIARLADVNLEQYQTMKVVGGLMAVGGFLGIIFSGFSK